MSTDRNEWLQWRHKGIGGSDAPVLHNASSYATVFDLHSTKILPKFVEQSSNFITDRGNEMEPIARVKFAAIWNMERFLPPEQAETFEAAKVEMIGLEFMKATLDGQSKDRKTIVEFKYMSKPTTEEDQKMTPGRQKHLDVHDESLPVTDANGERCRVPFNYWIQVQHQLLVSGAESCYFASFDGDTLKTCKVLPDIAFMEMHLQKCCDFWESVLAKKAPSFVADDFKSIRIKGGKAIAQQWKQLNVLKLETEDRMYALILELAAACSEGRFVCDGIYITKTKGGTVSVSTRMNG